MFQEEIFFATKRFVVIRDLKIKMADCSEHTVFEDNVMKVTYVPLIRSEEVLPDIQEEDEENSFGVQVGTSETVSLKMTTL